MHVVVDSSYFFGLVLEHSLDRIAYVHALLDRARAVRGGAVMAIVNVTPDSFSDGGLYCDVDKACARVDAVIAEGADCIDVGGESTRPGAAAVSSEEQWRRIGPVVEYAATRSCVSLDTTSAYVAARGLNAGAHIVNDVACGASDELLRVAAAAGAVYVLSHARGSQSAMAAFSNHPDDAYGNDVVAAVVNDLTRAKAHALGLGVAANAVIVDPGLGFTKNARQSLELLQNTREITERTASPVLIGASRKSFLTRFSGDVLAAERVGASLAAALWAIRAGAALVRVHDVGQTVQALTLEHVLRAEPRKRHETSRGANRD